MCGIAGFISAYPLKEKELLGVERMSEALIHRGPDSSGAYIDRNVALSIRRLKIIDIAGGDQPLFNENKSLALVVNGEIYNFVELRAELEGKGHVFKTRSDCETIIHLYEQYGEDCLHKLRGMFVFALHDQKRGEVILARDRLGEKPLYYQRTGTELVFSSEMKSLLLYLRPGGLEIDCNAINMYLHYQYTPEPFTCIIGVKKLPAAHFIRVKTEDFSFTLRKYWDIEDAAPVKGNPAELIRESFDELGKYIIRADVPVGVSLSGGLDSSAIACAADRHSKNKLAAFTVGYPGMPVWDERKQAESLAGKLGMEFRSAELHTENLVKSFQDLVYAMDDPIADVAAFGYYSVSKLAREHGVPVLLFGFGGDELFWGYHWARESLRRNFIKKEIRAGAEFSGLSLSDMARIFSGASKKRLLFHPVSSVKKIREELEALRRKFTKNPSRLILWDENQDFKAAFGFKKDIYTQDFENSISEDLLYAPFSTENWDSVPLKTCRFLLDPWNVSNSVPQGDRLGMAFSVESRLPFLDYKFMELVIGLRKTWEDDYKLGSKGWFVEAMKGVVPEDVLMRRKAGFTVPREAWMRAVVDHYSAYCLDGCLASAGIARKNRLADFFADVSSCGGKLFFAYKLVLLEIWLKRFFEGKNY